MRTDADHLLIPTYCRFIEAFETPDLQKAKALLEALPRSCPLPLLPP
jgi:hypothetical protein